MWGTFENSYFPTSRKETYYPTVILQDKNYPLKIVDIPDIPFFPVNSFYNLSDLQGKTTSLNNEIVLNLELACRRCYKWLEKHAKSAKDYTVRIKIYS